jgi:tetratricopeptide (TPR) repeat protein
VSSREKILSEFSDNIEKANDAESLLTLLESLGQLDLEETKVEGTEDSADSEYTDIHCFDLLSAAYDKAAQKITTDERFIELRNFSPIYRKASKFWKEQAAEAQKNSIKKLIQKGTELQVEKNYDEAIKIFSKAAELRPSEEVMSIILTLMGESYINLDKLEDATKTFRAAAEMDPNNSSAWFGIGTVQFRVQSYEDAIDSIKKAIEIAPNEVKLYVEIGLVFIQVKNYTEAKKYLLRALKIDGQSFLAYNALGGVYGDGFSQYEDAERCFRKALDLNPDSLTAKTNLAEVSILEGRYKEAEDLLNQVIEVTDSHKHGLASRILLVCSYFLHRIENTNIDSAVMDLVNYYHSLPKGYNFEWHFDGLKRTIKSSKLPNVHKDKLVTLLSSMEKGNNQDASKAANDLLKHILSWNKVKMSVLSGIRRSNRSKISAEDIEVDNTSESDKERYGWYSWDVFIGPQKILPNVQYVKYILHPSFQTNEVIIDIPEGGFRLKGAGWGEFRIKVEISLIDKQKLTKYHWLKLNGPTPLDIVNTDL